MKSRERVMITKNYLKVKRPQWEHPGPRNTTTSVDSQHHDSVAGKLKQPRKYGN